MQTSHADKQGRTGRYRSLDQGNAAVFDFYYRVYEYIGTEGKRLKIWKKTIGSIDITFITILYDDEQIYVARGKGPVIGRGTEQNNANDIPVFRYQTEDRFPNPLLKQFAIQ